MDERLCARVEDSRKAMHIDVSVNLDVYILLTDPAETG